jgi:hypothetical protein
VVTVGRRLVTGVTHATVAVDEHGNTRIGPGAQPSFTDTTEPFASTDSNDSPGARRRRPVAVAHELPDDQSRPRAAG